MTMLARMTKLLSISMITDVRGAILREHSLDEHSLDEHNLARTIATRVDAAGPIETLIRAHEESKRDDMKGGGDSPNVGSSDGHEYVVGNEPRPAVRRAKAHWRWILSKTLLAARAKKLARSKTVPGVRGSLENVYGGEGGTDDGKEHPSLAAYVINHRASAFGGKWWEEAVRSPAGTVVVRHVTHRRPLAPPQHADACAVPAMLWRRRAPTRCAAR